MRDGLNDEFASGPTARLIARALQQGWIVKPEQRAKAVEAAEWMIDTGRDIGDGALVAYGVRGIIAAEANDLRRLAWLDKGERLDGGGASEDHTIRITFDKGG